MAGRLAKGGAGVAATKVISTLLSLIVAVVLARMLGPNGYGVYAYVFTLVLILAIPAQLGMSRLVIRETTKADTHQKWGAMLGLWRWSSKLTMILSSTIVALALAILLLTDFSLNSIELKTAVWGLFLIPFFSLASLRGAALQGLRRVVLGQLPESIIRPVLFLFFLGLLSWWQLGQLTSDVAMAMQLLSALLAFIFGAWILLRARPDNVRSGLEPVYHSRQWFMAAWPMAVLTGMQQINGYADLIILGFFVSAEDIGVYRVAMQGGLLIAFGLQTVVMFVSPYFAQLNETGDLQRLRKLMIISARVSFVVGFPLLVVYCFWGSEILHYVFGEKYVSGYWPLVILSFGQLLNALFGPVGLLLNMTGHERDAMRDVMIAATCNIVLNLILIPDFGKEGAAMATAITMLIWNVLLWSSVRNRLGFNCFAFMSLAVRK